jgi:hypothetical protein
MFVCHTIIQNGLPTRQAGMGGRMLANIFKMTAIASLAFSLVTQAAQGAEPVLRIAVLKFGTVNWELDVIKHHGLDKANGFTLEECTSPASRPRPLCSRVARPT